METKEDKVKQQVFEALVSTIKLIDGGISDEKATNIIINVVNWKQTQLLKAEIKK